LGENFPPNYFKQVSSGGLNMHLTKYSMEAIFVPDLGSWMHRRIRWLAGQPHERRASVFECIGAVAWNAVAIVGASPQLLSMALGTAYAQTPNTVCGAIFSHAARLRSEPNADSFDWRRQDGQWPMVRGECADGRQAAW